MFCAGFDLKIIRGDDDAARDAMRKAGRTLLESVSAPAALLVACTGHALAAGALLLLTGDYRIGTAGDFKIGLNETQIGLTLPAFGLELARDRLRPTHLTTATALATLYGPDEALEAGYLDAVGAPDALAADAQTKRSNWSRWTVRQWLQPNCVCAPARSSALQPLTPEYGVRPACMR